jgi:hypothetical protein
MARTRRATYDRRRRAQPRCEPRPARTPPTWRRGSRRHRSRAASSSARTRTRAPTARIHEVLGGTAARLIPERGAPEWHHLGDGGRARDDEQALNGRRVGRQAQPPGSGRDLACHLDVAPAHRLSSRRCAWSGARPPSTSVLKARISQGKFMGEVSKAAHPAHGGGGDTHHRAWRGTRWSRHHYHRRQRPGGRSSGERPESAADA